MSRKYEMKNEKETERRKQYDNGILNDMIFFLVFFFILLLQPLQQHQHQQHKTKSNGFEWVKERMINITEMFNW